MIFLSFETIPHPETREDIITRGEWYELDELQSIMDDTGIDHIRENTAADMEALERYMNNGEPAEE